MTNAKRREMMGKIHAVLEADTENLRELCQVVGDDPRTFFIDSDLDGVDVRGQDLRGMDFSGATFDGAIMDDRTLFDAGQDPRLSGNQGVIVNMPSSRWGRFKWKVGALLIGVGSALKAGGIKP